MKTLIKLLIITLLFACNLSVLYPQNAAITINQITVNQKISGTVRNLDPKEYANYKVIVYVHTDNWYIHPYAAQGEGLSWVSIGKDGKWQIKTVQREFRADKVAAILVKKNYPEPNKAETLESIPRKAMIIRVLTNTQDYGKL